MYERKRGQKTKETKKKKTQTQANKQTKTFKNALSFLIVLLQTTAVFYSLIHAVVTKV